MFGGRNRPPYKSAGTSMFPANPAWRTPLPGGIYASPTNKGAAYTNHQNVALQYRFWVVTAFGPCVGAAYMPPAKRCGCCLYPVCMLFVLPCRAGVHARRTLNIFKNFIGSAGSRPRPANHLKTAEYLFFCAAQPRFLSALRAGPGGLVALRNGAAAPVLNAPAGAAPAEPIIF